MSEYHHIFYRNKAKTKVCDAQYLRWSDDRLQTSLRVISELRYQMSNAFGFRKFFLVLALLAGFALLPVVCFSTPCHERYLPESQEKDALDLHNASHRNDAGRIDHREFSRGESPKKTDALVSEEYAHPSTSFRTPMGVSTLSTANKKKSSGHVSKIESRQVLHPSWFLNKGDLAEHSVYVHIVGGPIFPLVFFQMPTTMIADEQQLFFRLNGVCMNQNRFGLSIHPKANNRPSCSLCSRTDLLPNHKYEAFLHYPYSYRNVNMARI